MLLIVFGSVLAVAMTIVFSAAIVGGSSDSPVSIRTVGSEVPHFQMVRGWVLMMLFESRELKSYAEPISEGDLKEGAVYFFVSFVDEEMLIPMLGTVVYVGRDLQPDEAGQLYFQDIESFKRGVRYETAVEATLQSSTPGHGAS